MSQTQSEPFLEGQPINGRHANHFLFSDYYLNELLFNSDAWRVQIEAALAFFKTLKKLYSAESSNLPTYNENQLETHWIQPILALMGWNGTYETQAVIPSLQTKGIRKPDYVGFASEDQRKSAAQLQNTPAYTQNAIVIGEVKRWGVPLNKKQQGKPTFENNNPSHQIDYYLRATDVRWGILTDGRYWRLVHKESSYKLDVYYEIDLQEILDSDSNNGILYFWLFFRHRAFVPDSQGTIFVDEALKASLNYAREVENDLRDNAYKALEQLIQGFFAFEGNRLSAENPEHLDAVYTNSLYLLYRLLFLMYGESRGLLPLKNPKYHEVSLSSLVTEIANKIDKGTQFSPFSTQYWARQQGLCHIINGTSLQANAYYGVPLYNGGLFSPTIHPFLEQYQMGDRYLLYAIDYLARRDRHKKGDYAIKERVDYRTLGVRQLGSIYEGLLEYRPARASEPMVTIRNEGIEVWVPATQLGRKKSLESRAIGELYLATDKGERKATGSYYTPDYIVKYIIEQTLQPLIDTIQNEVAALPENQRGATFAKRVLALKVLDPAMGSGHFLVAAAEYLALALTYADFVSAPHQSNDSELSELERQAQEKNYWLRRVTESSIYGVDKNSMAVELAKLSLWLTTVSADKPLSFLDHHLRHGDSLVGARLSDLVTLPSGKKSAESPQATLIDESQLTTDLNLAVGGMLAIERATSDTLDDIHLKEQIFGELRDHIGKWRNLADVWVSSYFGNGMSPQEYGDVARHLQGKQTTATAEQLRPFLDHSAVRDNDYFHWELEFPEVFFDEFGRNLQENGGFDAIIGNPPYVRQELFSEIKLFLQNQFKAFHGSADLYVYFIELGVKQLRQNGTCGLIVSHKFMRASYGEALRILFSTQTQLQEIIHFGDLPVFPDATAYPAILIFQRDEMPKRLATVSVTQIASLDFKEFRPFVAQQTYKLSNYGLQTSGWSLRNGAITVLQEKIQAQTVPLKSYLPGKIYYGIKTGLNEAFFIDEKTRHELIMADPNSVDLIKPLVIGEDVRRYRVNQKPYYLLFIHRNVNIENYPAVKSHLEKYRPQLEKRAGSAGWYALQASTDYAALFDAPKLIYPVISKRPRFAFDSRGLYPNDKCFVIDSVDFYLLGLLNSSLTQFLTKLLLSGLRGDYLEFRAVHLNQLPILVVDGTPDPNALDSMKKLWQTEMRSLPNLLSSNTKIVLRDFLAWSAEQMVALYSAKQRIEEKFWLDLEGMTEKDIFVSLQKGKWEESLHQQIPATQRFLRGDSRSSKMLDASLGWNEEAYKGFVKLLVGKVKGMSDLLDVYRTYHADYKALSEKIAATDALINQIVYQLYGLTDEEIALIEAAT